MKKIKDLIEKLLENPPTCKKCNISLTPIEQGVIFVSDKPAGYIVMFRCPKCRSIAVAIIQVKIKARNSLRASFTFISEKTC